MAGPEKTKTGLRDKLRQKREARKQRGRASASWRAEPVPRNAQHHA